ncbi:MAG: fatty-acid--CoA ligase [Sphingomonadales bacterium]|nr:MAG: fatty-acid--CoA ligase [Sphingomonadales bacterium]TNF03752.1 MAG: fatty-acid--CoA ligase [Sphingomonadales bacterium]
MQAWPLTVNKFIEHAARWHGSRTVVSRAFDGSINRMSWADIHRHAAHLSNALVAYGIGQGDRVATLAMNSGRHVAAWYGIMGMGAICHTLNPRLSVEQLVYIINHAADRIVFVDRQFMPLIEQLQPQCPSLQTAIILDEDGQGCWDAFVDGQSDSFDWGAFDENSGAGLCYTSGTTGNPKGVLYTHRSNYLHTMMALQPDALGIGVREVIMPVVPMFHANGWSIPFAASAAGCKMVMPGAHLDGQSLHDLIEKESVTLVAGVPTVWFGLLEYVRKNGKEFTSLKRLFVGGAACAESLIRDFADYGVDVVHTWGMTELSPIGTVGRLTPEVLDLADDEQLGYRMAQGRPLLGIDMRVADENGQELSRDGATIGAIQVRGQAIVGRYFRAEEIALNDDGFFDTGDVGTIDARGYMRITDRAKDVIKSGGEWISSVDLENAAMSHPGVQLAAAVGIAHPKWNERPLLLVKRKAGNDVTEEDIHDVLARKLARLAIPDAILFTDDIPLGATGKIDKKRIRADYKDFYVERG